VPVCPEVLGGLAIPRPACEIVGGDGYEVLKCRAKVVDRKGKDYSKYFILVAQKVLDFIKQRKIKAVYLKSKSTSCGYGWIFLESMINL